VVTPGLSSAATMSSTSRPSLQTFRIASIPFASSISIFFLFNAFSLIGMPVSAQSGCGMDFGTGRLGESG